MFFHRVGKECKRVGILSAGERVLDFQSACENLSVVNVEESRNPLDVLTWHELLEFMNPRTVLMRRDLLERNEQILGEGWVRRVQVDRGSVKVEMHDWHNVHVLKG